MDFYIPGVAKVGGFSLCSSPGELEQSGTLDLAIKESSWPPADWLHRKAKVGDSVSMVVGSIYIKAALTTESKKKPETNYFFNCLRRGFLLSQLSNP